MTIFLSMKTNIFSLSSSTHQKCVSQSVETLRSGGIIIYPTDTIYGIGADATNDFAIEKIYHIKQRDSQKPLLILASSLEMVKHYTKNISSTTEELLKKYWPGSVTFIFQANSLLPSSLTLNNTIGIRIPNNIFCLDVINELRKPIISTSANISQQEGGTKIAEIQKDFFGKVNVIINAGDVENSLPSTVVDVSGKISKIVRQGVVEIKDDNL